jgi:hypothetical protein
MARTTDQPSAATRRIIGTDPAREANGHGPLGDEQGHKDQVGQPVGPSTVTDRRQGPAADRGEDDRLSERRDLRKNGDEGRGFGEKNDSPGIRGGYGRRDTDGVRATTNPTAALTEQARETAADNTHELQDAVLGVVRQGQDATLALVGMWTETLRRPGPFGVAPARAAISGGYDLFAQLLAEQRRFVDALIDQQRRFAEALLAPPDHR